MKISLTIILEVFESSYFVAAVDDNAEQFADWDSFASGWD